jgi:hypothetical protein
MYAAKRTLKSTLIDLLSSRLKNKLYIFETVLVSGIQSNSLLQSLYLPQMGLNFQDQLIQDYRLVSSPPALPTKSGKPTNQSTYRIS